MDDIERLQKQAELLDLEKQAAQIRFDLLMDDSDRRITDLNTQAVKIQTDRDLQNSTPTQIQP